MKIEYSLSQLLAENIEVNIDGDTLSFTTADGAATEKLCWGMLPEQLHHGFKLDERVVETLLEDMAHRIEDEILAARLKDCRM